MIRPVFSACCPWPVDFVEDGVGRRFASPSRMADAMRAEASGEDLVEEGGRVAVLAKREDGTFYSLGSVDPCSCLQVGANPQAMLDRVKFGGPR